MANSRPQRTNARILLAMAASLSLCPQISNAQQTTPSGFAVERLYLSAPGAGWFVMDDLNLSGRLGGAVSLTSGYERNPLVITSGNQAVAVVSQQSYFTIGGALTYERFRAYLSLPFPVLVTGKSGTIANATGTYQFTAPNLTLGTTPDEIGDTMLGFDARLLGRPGDLFRLGAGAQLIAPSGSRSDSVSDARYRGMLRLLAAGDSGAFRYAGQVGVHLRPLNDAPVPGSPNGNELLYGIAGGEKFPSTNGWAVIVGPEIFGQTAVHSFFNGETGTEALLTARLEQTSTEHNLRLKLGVGHALRQNFGAAQWRVVFGVELFGHK